MIRVLQLAADYRSGCAAQMSADLNIPAQTCVHLRPTASATSG
jgi:hypothetical protein